MEKKSSIIGFILIAFIFLGYSIYNTHQQRKIAERIALEERAAKAAQAAQAAHPAQVQTQTAGQTLQNNGLTAVIGNADSVKIAAETFTVENDYLVITFDTQGGQIRSAELKEYTKYAEKGESKEQVKLFDPQTANFNLEFNVKNGYVNMPINTADHVFEKVGVEKTESGQRVTMRLPVFNEANAGLVYVYTIHNSTDPSRDYMVDFSVRFENMAPYMARETRIGIDWSNTSYQNERGFKNENMYTTISYREPGEKSISELSMGTGTKDKKISTQVNWIAFKQQFFSSVFIADGNFSEASMKYETNAPDSKLIKNFSAEMSVPFNPQTEDYSFAFYLGPNKYAILKNIDRNGEKIAMERLIPLGWGIFGWVNRWFTIPVFDLLRNYIPSFGIIILILAVLVKLIISPLTYKSYLSTAKMRVIKPEMDAINAKYPKQEDAMKKQQAMMELYKKAGINPLGGCLPMLIQMPIIIAMFRFFPASIELRGQKFLWSHDLSSYDSVLNLPFSIPFYGDHVSLFALLMTIVFFLYSFLNYKQTASNQPQMLGMKFMMVYLMPLMMLFWFNDYSSGLSYYYFLTTILSMIQTYAIRYMVDDNKIHAMIQVNAAKKSNGKKSRFQQRYEEQMRMYQEQMSKNKKGK